MGARQLGNRERLKGQFRTALVTGLSPEQRDEFVRQLADRMRVPAGESTEETLERLLNYVFGV
jgi:hypothetical protein